MEVPGIEAKLQRADRALQALPLAGLLRTAQNARRRALTAQDEIDRIMWEQIARETDRAAEIQLGLRDASP